MFHISEIQRSHHHVGRTMTEGLQDYLIIEKIAGPLNRALRVRIAHIC